ncbi:MAG: homoserine kinase [Acidobacteria bacterium]|nr:homoserine kinase [Acidobacteriota bacterium]
MEQVSVIAPATVSNVVCGFDCLGFALEKPVDKIVLRRIDETGVRIVNHDDFDLPSDPEKNAAGVTLLAMLDASRVDFGFELKSYKNIKPGSGIGSSAASSCGAAVAANEILGRPFSKRALAEFALEGENLASGSRHADNVAPCIFGGFTLVRSVEPLDIVSLRFPPLFVTVIHPQIEIRTADARSVLPREVPLASAVRNWANLGALVAALTRADYDLIGRSLEDLIVEPVRKSLIPKFDDVKAAALFVGAVGGGISGSGPSVFMLSRTSDTAAAVEKELQNVYSKTGIEFYTYISRISGKGASIT